MEKQYDFRCLYVADVTPVLNELVGEGWELKGELIPLHPDSFGVRVGALFVKTKEDKQDEG